ncbi:MAG: hypothetical protein IM585_05520 [Pseudanabaena sp. M135S2SP2A07QC]|nr:hypothetical protein [Pseudanabaena sp. M172S2SP2A07QC]MCA6523028.1 hypothetical protein [Pseudanabaena sp. M051S1SP2A07QC]MCA6525902.1 hypothetical protein [Pseudanabaena sp. M179S2SP2A07QC]MCA6531431.1 hypothetical protein [Pseudanabaena sp. M125S2SP2A07QC]MCA6534172.1 hypothetical protein [Pseudanabaena sp. M176S2SP2A07QC]MCA6540832.1 hypothetical protein [Pseudanabaena sp. M037S2SP2A07QC]MCA6549928.1 hypothetical protein [Pseudanabaena sp. M152S2SP2A07QC]MCA6551477.1 hypothetical prot
MGDRVFVKGMNGRSCFCEWLAIVFWVRVGRSRFLVGGWAIVFWAIALYFFPENQRYNMFEDKIVHFVMAYESYNQLRSST